MDYKKFYKALLMELMKCDGDSKAKKPQYSLSPDGVNAFVSYCGYFGVIVPVNTFPFNVDLFYQNNIFYEYQRTRSSLATPVGLTDNLVVDGKRTLAVFDDDTLADAKLLAFFPKNATYTKYKGCFYVYSESGSWLGAVMGIQKKK
jgi:hypothetical protein